MAAKQKKNKSLNIKEPKIEDQPPLAENEILQTLIIEDVKYKTRFTKKFINRKVYVPKNPKKVFSFIPGTIKKIYVSKGKKAKAGDKLLDLDAMKMVNTIFVEENSTIADIFVKEGDMVPKNHLLVEYK